LNSLIMKVHLVLLSIQFAFAGWHVLGKTALNSGVEPLLLALYRGLFSALLLIVTAWYLQKNGHINTILFQTKHSPRFILMGFLNYGNMVGSIVGLKYTSAINYAILQPSIPVFAMGLSFFLGLEPATRMKALGVLVSAVGAVYVECQSMSLTISEKESYQPILGNTIIISQCLSMAGLTVVQKPFMKTYPAIVVVAWHSLFAACFTTLTCMVSGLETLWFEATDTLAWVALVYAVVVASYYCYFAYGWALKVASPTVVLAYSTFQPVGTMILSYIFMGTHTTTENIIGGAIVVLGLVLTMWNSSKEEEKKDNRLHQLKEKDKERGSSHNPLLSSETMFEQESTH